MSVASRLALAILAALLAATVAGGAVGTCRVSAWASWHIGYARVDVCGRHVSVMWG